MSLGVAGGTTWFRVPVVGAMTDNNVRAACLALGLRTPCAGEPGCTFNDTLCSQINYENSCGNPMLRLSQAICNGQSPSQCTALNGVYQYMGNNWVSNSACGALSGNWCSQGSEVTNQFALCVAP